MDVPIIDSFEVAFNPFNLTLKAFFIKVMAFSSTSLGLIGCFAFDFNFGIITFVVAFIYFVLTFVSCIILLFVLCIVIFNSSIFCYINIGFFFPSSFCFNLYRIIASCYPFLLASSFASSFTSLDSTSSFTFKAWHVLTFQIRPFHPSFVSFIYFVNSIFCIGHTFILLSLIEQA